MAEEYIINQQKFEDYFEKYLDAIKNSNWLSEHEAYKFRFAQWLNQNINFENQTDKEILEKCKESQKQNYTDNPSEKGINFIISGLRFKDTFITIDDIKAIRSLLRKDISESIIKNISMSLPKFSVWIGILIPIKYFVYANEELTKGLADLFDLEKYPKRGFKSFQIAQSLLSIVKKEIKIFEKDLTAIFNQVLNKNKIEDYDWNWLVQDFNLYIIRRIQITNYWWVCQGNSYKQEKERGIIKAPDDVVFHHSNLKKLKVGDKIIHYAKGEIKAISTVEDEYNLDEVTKFLYVDLKYEPLDKPIPLEEIQSKLKEKIETLPQAYSPFNNKLEINQGYLYNFNKEAFEIIFSDKIQQSYWIFQANPKIWKIFNALKNNEVETWSIFTHKDKIHKGDKFILYASGKYSGIYATGEVRSDIYFAPEKKSQLKYCVNPDPEKINDRVAVKIDYNWINNPILKEEIKKNPKLNKLKVGSQGTNFSATQEEYHEILKMRGIGMKRKDIKYWLYSPGDNANKWDGFFQKGIMAIGWDETGDLNKFKTKTEIQEKLKSIYGVDSSKVNDTLACYEFNKTLNIGDIIIAKKGQKEYIGFGIVDSDYFFNDSEIEYKHKRKVKWMKKGTWLESGGPIVVKTLTDISKYPEYVEKLKKLIGINLEEAMRPMTKYPLNQILYGPPGTGKTYLLKNYYAKDFIDEAVSQTESEYYSELVQKLSWWQLLTFVMLDLESAKVNEIFDHPLVQTRISIYKTNTPKNTIWGQLMMRTKDDCPNVKMTRREKEQIFWKDENSVWSIDKEAAQEQVPDLFDLYDEYKNFTPTTKREERFNIVTFHQSFSYEDFIEGIKPKLVEADEETPDTICYHIEPGVFKRITDRAKANPDKNYAIFIDEINRGNIANIFGELITLIEEDKRVGNSQELTSTLPYSKEEFGVPNNLYIIGTMNTADRSVEALDTALRRRFSFVEVNPDSDKLNENEFKCKGIDLAKMLKTINDRIEKILDRDHCIGHSYFMTIRNKENPLDDLKRIFFNNVLPLLKEYFYGDWGKVLLILGKEFVSKQDDGTQFLGEDMYEEFEEFESKVVYNFSKPKDWTLETFKSIYENQ